jgi:hypothetical protein
MFDCYTHLDDQNRMTGHFCPTGDCFHCKAGVPFANPPIELLPRMSDTALAALKRENDARLEQAQGAVRVIEAEQQARAERG